MYLECAYPRKPGARLPACPPEHLPAPAGPAGRACLAMPCHALPLLCHAMEGSDSGQKSGSKMEEVVPHEPTKTITLAGNTREQVRICGYLLRYLLTAL